MADKKISALTAATTPLAGTEVLPIVQSASTVKATIANLQATPVTAGTANAVQYLNGSKVPTTSSNLIFNGSSLGIGISPSQKLTVGGAADAQMTIVSNTTTGGSEIYLGDSDSVFRGLIAYAHTSDSLSIYTAAAKAIEISSTQNVSLTAGNLVIGTSGKGIDFSATPGTGTSELLDDYEEGTWTPTVFGSTGAGTYELSANSSFTYQKVGNNVTVLARIVAAAVVTGGGTGDIRISGLPFNMSATVYGSPFTAVSSGVVFTGSYLGAERVTGGSTATVYPYGISALGVQTQVPVANFVANSVIAFQFQYRV